MVLSNTLRGKNPKILLYKLCLKIILNLLMINEIPLPQQFPLTTWKLGILSSYFLHLSSITPFSLISYNPTDHLKEATSHEILKQRDDI